jgi:hypothetical protein
VAVGAGVRAPLLSLGVDNDDGRHGHDGHDDSYVSFRIAPDRALCTDCCCCGELWCSKMPFFVSGREDALEILKKRYAKGEIGKEEYERIKRDIE